jgi:hypothetical protein
MRVPITLLARSALSHAPQHVHCAAMLLRAGADLSIPDSKACAAYSCITVTFSRHMAQGCTAPQLARIHGTSTISSLVRSDSGEQLEQQVFPPPHQVTRRSFPSAAPSNHCTGGCPCRREQTNIFTSGWTSARASSRGRRHRLGAGCCGQR